jgi:hypothetical protein
MRRALGEINAAANLGLSSRGETPTSAPLSLFATSPLGDVLAKFPMTALN